MKKETMEFVEKMRTKAPMVEQPVEPVLMEKEEEKVVGCKYLRQQPVFFLTTEEQEGLWKLVWVCTRFSNENKTFRCHVEAQEQCDFYEKGE